MMRLLLLSIFTFPVLAWGQDLLNFFSPGARTTSIELEGNYLPNKPAEKSDETQVFERGGRIQQKIFGNKKDTVFVGARYNELDLSSSENLLRDYYNQDVSLSYRRTLPDDLFWLASVSYGSASDRPFQNSRDNTLSATYIQKYNLRWYGVLNYSNNRTFLNNIPLPGVFYVKELRPDSALVVGFPFIYWLKPLSENWSFRYLGFLPWSHRLKLLYRWGKLFPYIGYEESPESYFRHDRDNDEDRVFWFERRAMMGVESTIGKNLRLDISGGWAFDRQFFEARNFTDEKEQLNNIDSSLFVSLKLNLHF